jgi:hypothetical protein
VPGRFMVSARTSSISRRIAGLLIGASSVGSIGAGLVGRELSAISGLRIFDALSYAGSARFENLFDAPMAKKNQYHTHTRTTPELFIGDSKLYEKYLIIENS